jgi:hypothetical protein
VNNDREPLLVAYGRFYGEERFAVAFTASVDGERAKRVTTAGWDKTKPLPNGEFAAGLIGKRGLSHNVAIVLRPSNLVVIECDSEPDLVRIESLGLPQTLTVRSSAPYKRHFYFRPPEQLEALPYVAFRFESGKLTADSGRYFLAPPSVHPSGTLYAFLPGLGPGETDIVELPEHVYRDLCEQARRETSEQRERIRVEPEAKILAGQRRDLIFRYACMLRRWGRPYEAILAECQAFNLERCEPPVPLELVTVQVNGAMKKEGDQELDITPSPIVFEPLRAFLTRDLPPAESLVGVTRNGTNLLPRYGWVMPWGREGSGKTSVVIDLLYHAAAGIDWLGWPIGRPLHVVVVVNEGIPGGFQDKLTAKLETWPGDTEIIRDNVAVYASPWGEFTFRNERMATHARAFALDFGADYVALDPLHTLGSSGGGRPDETEAFKHVLRSFGVWADLGVITAHHSNKAGMISGDWARHPDTVIHLEKDGKNPATKLTLEKARPADPHELGVPVLLEWNVETLGYVRKVLEPRHRTSDDELDAKIRDELATASAPLTMGALQKAVGGDTKRTRERALELLKRREIRDLSTGGNAYRFAPGETESPDAPDAGSGTPQTRMAIEAEPGETESPGGTEWSERPERDDASGGPVGWYVVPPTGHQPDELSEPDTKGESF